MYFTFDVSPVIRGSQNFVIGSGDPGHAHLGGHFEVHTHEGSVLHLITKFEADRSTYSKVIKGVPKFRNWVT